VVGVGVDVEEPGAAPERLFEPADNRRVAATETLGTASRSDIRRSDQQLAAAEDRLAVDFDVGS